MSLSESIFTSIQFLLLLLPYKSWVVETYFSDSDLARVLQVGNYNSSTISSEGAIDAKAEVTSTQVLPEKTSRDP